MTRLSFYPKECMPFEMDDETNTEVLEVALKGLADALTPFYPSEWKLKYSIMANGPGRILSRNLELKKIVTNQNVTR